MNAMQTLADGVVFIDVEVGLRDAYKNPANPFRLHELVKIESVPTLFHLQSKSKFDDYAKLADEAEVKAWVDSVLAK